jgi:DNA-binding ferritin-like protein (Dps family)
MSYSLDDIRAAAEKKYGSVDILVGETTVSLVNALRLPKEKRTALFAVQEELDSDAENQRDQEEVLADALRLVAATDEQAAVLLDAIGDDLAVMAEIFSTYAKGTQAGEA